MSEEKDRPNRDWLGVIKQKPEKESILAYIQTEKLLAMTYIEKIFDKIIQIIKAIYEKDV